MRTSSNWWYAQFIVDGKRQTFNLDVEITGKRPRSINEPGDKAFEDSRLLAQSAHDRKRREMDADRHGVQAAQAVVRLRTGKGVQFPVLSELVAEWEKIPRRRQPCNRYTDQCRNVLQRFVDYMSTHHPDVTVMVDTTEAMAAEFLLAEEQRGISGKQYNETLKLLRSSFRRLHQRLGVMTNPFYVIPYRETETVHRRPFTPEELRLVSEAVKNDDFMRPLVTCGMCTAMRLGDCCLLRWKDVDLKENFIRVKTQKTGETVEIPVFPPFRAELERADRSGEYVFPKQSTMYRSNPAGLSYRFKKALIRAGFDRPQKPGPDEAPQRSMPTIPDDDLRLRVYAVLDKMEPPINQPRKPALMRQAFDLYVGGKTIPQISEGIDVSRGTASNYLNELEDKVGASIINRRPTGVRSAQGKMRVKREHGTRRASTMDFHSFRVTWVTLALTKGIPMDLVRVVTGHRTVEIVLKHYFKPQREDLRAALQKNMPALLTGPADKDAGKLDIKQILATANETNAWETLQQLQRLVE